MYLDLVLLLPVHPTGGAIEGWKICILILYTFCLCTQQEAQQRAGKYVSEKSAGWLYWGREKCAVCLAQCVHSSTCGS